MRSRAGCGNVVARQALKPLSTSHATWCAATTPSVSSAEFSAPCKAATSVQTRNSFECVHHPHDVGRRRERRLPVLGARVHLLEPELPRRERLSLSDPRIEGGILGPSSHANTARKGEGWQRSTISLQGSSWQRASLTLRIPAADPSRTTGWRVVPVGQGRKCARSMTDRASCPRELASLAESNQAMLALRKQMPHRRHETLANDRLICA